MIVAALSESRRITHVSGRPVAQAKRGRNGSSGTGHERAASVLAVISSCWNHQLAVDGEGVGRGKESGGARRGESWTTCLLTCAPAQFYLVSQMYDSNGSTVTWRLRSSLLFFGFDLSLFFFFCLFVSLFWNCAAMLHVRLQTEFIWIFRVF